MNIELWFDGACEPRNPGGVGTFGWVIRGIDGHGDITGAGVAGEGPGMTNNVAEWSALLAALNALAEFGLEYLPGDRLVIRGDSKLVINQLLRTWACNAPALAELRSQCTAALAFLTGEQGLEGFAAEWIPREQNEQADALSQRAYVKHTGRPFPTRAVAGSFRCRR